MDKLVSVIVPCYNVAEYIGQCIQSICKSTYTNLEIILLDDGSTDTTLDVLYSYQKDSRLIILTHENRGVSFTRNRGLEKASGTYILFIDADDWIAESSIYEYVEKIQKTKADMVISEHAVVIESIHNQQQFEYKSLMIPECNSNDEVMKQVFARMIGISSREIDIWNQTGILSYKTLDGIIGGKLYRRDIIHSNNIFFDENLSIKEDTFFNLNYLLYCDKISCIHHALYFYRIRKDRTNTVANVKYDLHKYYINKYGLLQARCTLRNKVINYMNIDIITSYAGSIALSVIEIAICCARSKQLHYKDLKKYLNKGAMESVRLMQISYTNIKFNFIIVLLRLHMSRILYMIITFLVYSKLDRKFLNVRSEVIK